MEREPTPFASNVSGMEGTELETPDDRYGHIEPLEVYHPLDDFDIDVDVPEYGPRFTTETRVLQIRALKDHLDLEPELVYYPGSGTDTAPSKAFSESDVLHVDIDEYGPERLEELGYEAICADAEELQVENIVGQNPDVIFMYDYSGSNPEEIISQNRSEGNWLIADKIFDNDLEPVAGVTLTDDGYLEIHDSRPCNIVASRMK